MKMSRVHRIVVTIVVVLFGILDFLPHYGPPHFRYTGSDPDQHVLNLGYPLAAFILDWRNSPFLFVAPHSYLLIPLQAAILLALITLPKLLRRDSR